MDEEDRQIESEDFEYRLGVVASIFLLLIASLADLIELILDLFTAGTGGWIVDVLELAIIFPILWLNGVNPIGTRQIGRWLIVITVSFIPYLSTFAPEMIVGVLLTIIVSRREDETGRSILSKLKRRPNISRARRLGKFKGPRSPRRSGDMHKKWVTRQKRATPPRMPGTPPPMPANRVVPSNAVSGVKKTIPARGSVDGKLRTSVQVVRDRMGATPPRMPGTPPPIPTKATPPPIPKQSYAPSGGVKSSYDTVQSRMGATPPQMPGTPPSMPTNATPPPIPNQKYVPSGELKSSYDTVQSRMGATPPPVPQESKPASSGKLKSSNDTVRSRMGATPPRTPSKYSRSLDEIEGDSQSHSSSRVTIQSSFDKVRGRLGSTPPRMPGTPPPMPKSATPPPLPKQKYEPSGKLKTSYEAAKTALGEMPAPNSTTPPPMPDDSSSNSG